jgi:thiamine pyrophosphate-dependent acetolactate synthase large subunit-like protein
VAPTGAQAIVTALAGAGVDTVFGLPGVHNLSLWKALDGSGIRMVGVRHEQTAAYAADGYARASGRVGVALVTTGPGAANAAGAIGEAYASRSPVVLIATDIATTLRRSGPVRGALHETSDQRAMFAPVTIAQLRASPGDAGALAAQALAEAHAHPRRPVFLEVPTDLLDAPAQMPRAVAAIAGGAPAAADVATVLLRDARRPLVWAGGGALADGAGPLVGEVAQRLGAPVILTPSARGLLAPSHPLLAGPPHAEPVGALWDAADVVVAIGSDLDGTTTQNWRQPQPPVLVAVNVDGADARKNYRVDVLLQTTASAGCAALLDGLGPARAPWADLDAVRAAVAAIPDADARAFLDGIAAAAGEEAVVVCDMCIPGYWIGAFGRVSGPRRLAYPMGWGTLGFGFPASIGAALGHDGPTIAVCGDGGFLFACGELATVAQERPRLVTVIVDDGGYGMLRWDQDARGDERSGVDLHTPDFVALARSFGVPAHGVDGLGADFARVLASLVREPGPSVLVARASLQPPPSTSPRWYRA